MTAGGAVGVAMTRHLAIAPAELDYSRTGFNNRANDCQNTGRFWDAKVARGTFAYHAFAPVSA
jgi:hypothetical protein